MGMANFPVATDMTTIQFERHNDSPESHYWIWWQGELRTFRDREASEAFAKRQGLCAVFPPIDDGHDGSEA